MDGLPVKFVEGVNEPNNGGGFYDGTIAQLVTMQQTVYNAAKAYDPTIQALCPPVGSFSQGGTNGPGNAVGGYTLLEGFLQAGGGSYCDIIAFHGYSPNSYLDTSPIVPSAYNSGMEAFIAMIAANGAGSKPLWNTEYSSLSGVPANDATFLAWSMLMNWNFGVVRNYYYAYDNGSPSDVLWGPPTSGVPGVLNVAGIAYENMLSWINGASILVPLAETGVVWTIDFTQSNGAHARAVWTDDGSTPSYTTPSWAGVVKTISGGSSTPGSTVTLQGRNPIMLSAP